MTTPSAQLPPEAEDKRGPRFSSHVRVQDSGCWTWTGPHHEGYGRFRFERRTFAAHRFAYERLVSPLLADHQLDHTCQNRTCVNPAHLRPILPMLHSLVTSWRNTHDAGVYELGHDALWALESETSTRPPFYRRRAIQARADQAVARAVLAAVGMEVQVGLRQASRLRRRLDAGLPPMGALAGIRTWPLRSPSSS